MILTLILLYDRLTASLIMITNYKLKVSFMSVSSSKSPSTSTRNNTRKTYGGCWVLLGVAVCTVLLFYSIFWGLMSQPKGSKGHSLKPVKRSTLINPPKSNESNKILKKSIQQTSPNTTPKNKSIPSITPSQSHSK